MTDLATGLTTAEAAALSAVADDVAQCQRAADAALARLTRSLAAAEWLADTFAAGQRASTREKDMARRTVASEIAVPLRLSDRGVQARMSDAATVVTDYPAAVDAWEQGRIGRGHVHVITRAGDPLPPEQRAVFDAKAVQVCQRMTPGRAKPILEMLAARLHPRTMTKRHADARANRGVSLEPLGEGMSRLTADLPTILGEGIWDRLYRQAEAFIDARAVATTAVRAARAAGTPDEDIDPGDRALAADTRRVAEVRVDILTDLLLTGAPDVDPTADADGPGELGAIRARVHVVVNATTLGGADELPADLGNGSLIPAVQARELAGDCTGFDRIFLHPKTGQLLHTDAYTPTAEMRRRLRARDRHCRFPGCRVPAIRCEADHTVDHALGGPTCLTNMAGLCQRHHTMKQFTPWKVRQLGDGVLEWTSPTGRIYIDEPPPPVVFFHPDDGTPPPF